MSCRVRSLRTRLSPRGHVSLLAAILVPAHALILLERVSVGVWACCGPPVWSDMTSRLRGTSTLSHSRDLRVSDIRPGLGARTAGTSFQVWNRVFMPLFIRHSNVHPDHPRLPLKGAAFAHLAAVAFAPPELHL